MGAAELIDLMMNFVIYPCLIIVHPIVQKSVIHIVLLQPIYNLNKKFKLIYLHAKAIYLNLRNEKPAYLYPSEVDHNTTFSSTWNISNLHKYNQIFILSTFWHQRFDLTML